MGGGERGFWDWEHVYAHGRFMLMCGKANTVFKVKIKIIIKKRKLK